MRKIAMKMTGYEWKSIKSKFKKKDILGIDKVPRSPYLYVINFYRDNYEFGIGHYDSINADETHETFNAKIFLEACGIEFEEYKITKEQILELHSRAKQDGVSDNNLRKWFPDCFKKELIVGRWYKVTDTTNQFRESEFALVLYSNEKGLHKGFGYRKNWTETFKNLNEVMQRNTDIVTEATTKEVEDALIKQWEKLGGEKGVTIKWNGHNGKAIGKPYWAFWKSMFIYFD